MSRSTRSRRGVADGDHRGSQPVRGAADTVDELGERYSDAVDRHQHRASRSSRPQRSTRRRATSAAIPPLSEPAADPAASAGRNASHDPRPTRRPSGAEQMTYDPVDQSVDLADLVDEQADEADELRSYLRSSGGTLFSGETVADDLARRGW